MRFQLITICSTLCLALLSSTTEAKTIPNATKKTLRRNEKEEMWHSTDRRTQIVQPVKKASDLDETKLYENFTLGYSFERPSNWSLTSIVSATPPYDPIPTFRTPGDSLHPRVASFSVARIRIDKTLTSAQLLERGIKVFSGAVTLENVRNLTGSTIGMTYGSQNGEQGKLVVLPRPDKKFAYALRYRADDEKTFSSNSVVFDHVLKTFNMTALNDSARSSRSSARRR